MGMNCDTTISSGKVLLVYASLLCFLVSRCRVSIEVKFNNTRLLSDISARKEPRVVIRSPTLQRLHSQSFCTFKPHNPKQTSPDMFVTIHALNWDRGTEKRKRSVALYRNYKRAAVSEVHFPTTCHGPLRHYKHAELGELYSKAKTVRTRALADSTKPRLQAPVHPRR